jgi:hypothetical protein
MDGYYEGDDHSGYPERRALPVLNIPTSVIVTGLLIWSALALGVWWLVDPLLSWISGAVGPLADTGTGLAKWFGLVEEAAALRDAANIEGLIGWAGGSIHFLAKVVVLLVWVAGLIALIAIPAVLRRGHRRQ